MYHFGWFVYVEPSLWPRINPVWVWFMILSIVVFHLLTFWWGFLHLYFLRYWPVIFYSYIFVLFRYQSNVGLIEWVWKCSLSLNFFSFIFISWRLITLQYCSGFCHILTWISHGFTYIPHPDPPSHLPLYPIPLGLPSAPGPSSCLMHPKCFEKPRYSSL